MPYVSELGYVSNQEHYDYRAELDALQERAEEDALMAEVAFDTARLAHLRARPVIATFELSKEHAQELAPLNDCESDFVKVTVRDLDDGDYWYELEYSTDPVWQEIDMSFDSYINHRTLIYILITQAVNPEHAPTPR